MASIRQFWDWFLYTSRIVGAPILAILIVWGIQKVTYTGTCFVGGLKCEQSIGADQSLVNYMGDLLAENPGADIVTAKRK